MLKKLGIPVMGYYAIMAISLIFLKVLWGRDYQSEDFNHYFLPFMGLLSLWTGYWIHKQHSRLALVNKGARKPARGGGFYLVLMVLCLLSIWAIWDSLLAGKWVSLGVLILDAALIGLAEEGMFRYYLLGQVQDHLSKRKAVIVSACLFAFLHVFNLIGNMSLDQVANQLVTTLIMGAFLAAAYLVTGKIGPIILFHALWDFLIFSDLASQVSWLILFMLSLLPIQALLALYYYVKLGNDSTRS